MTDSNNPVLGNPGAGSVNSSASISVGDITVEGNVEGHFVVGNNNQIYEGSVNNYYGDVYNLQVEEPIVKRHSVNPQPPRPPRGFIGREAEMKWLERSIAAKDATFVYGQEGLGKTYLVKQVAHSDPANQMPDGTVLIEGVDESGKALGFEDVVQSLFDTFFNSTPPLKVNFPKAKTHLGNTAPLVILDGFDFPASAYDKFPDLFPKGALIVANRNLSADDDIYQAIELTPLERNDAIQLLAGKSGIAADIDTQAVMDRICELCGDVPLAISKLAKTIKRKSLDLSTARAKLENVQTPSSERVQVAIERSFGVIFPLLSSAERATLITIAAAPGISVDRAWLESVTHDRHAVGELEALELIQANSPRMRMPEGFRQVIYASPIDLGARRETLLTYLSDQLKSRSLDFDFVADELGNILGLLAWAVNEKRWADVVALGRAVDPYLTLRGFWDAWGSVLEGVLLAGQNMGEKAIQAWALHQLGSREIGVGTKNQAIDYLARALRIRETLGDEVGTAYTRHNLNMILPPPSPEQPDGDGSDSLFNKLNDSIRYQINEFQELTGMFLEWCSVHQGWFALALLIVLILIAAAIFWVISSSGNQPTSDCQRPEGWSVYTVQEGDSFESISQRVAFAINGELYEKVLPVVKLAIESANFNCPGTTDTPGILPPQEPEVNPGEKVFVPEDPVEPLEVPPTSIPTRPPKMNLTLTFRATNDGNNFDTVGQTINYNYTVTNLGQTALSGPVIITDDKATTDCPDVATVGNLDDSLDPDESITCMGTYSITQADLDAGSVTTFTTAGAGGATSRTVTTTVSMTQDSVLTLTKTANMTTYDQIGQVITFAYIILNSGTVDIGPTQFTINDSLISSVMGAPINCGLAGTTLQPNEWISCTASYTITQADLNASSVTSTATATATDDLITTDPVTTTITNSSSTQYPQNLSLVISKQADPAFYTQVGQEITYTYTILNNGNVTLSPIQVFVRDEYINGGNVEFNCGSDAIELAPGESVSCTAGYTIMQADIDAGSVTNLASASIYAFGYNLMQNQEELFRGNQTASTTINYALAPTLEKTANRGSYDAVDQEITYTYTVKNINDVSLPGPVTVTDDRVEVTCSADNTITLNENTFRPTATITDTTSSLSVTATETPLIHTLIGTPTSTPPLSTLDEDLNPNETIFCTGTYTISQDDLDFGSVTNTAIAHVGEIDSNQETVRVEAIQRRELELIKTANPNTFDRVGQTITYAYETKNVGNVTLGPAQFAISDDRINSGTSFNCGSDTTELAPAESFTCTNTYSISPADLENRSVTNNAIASVTVQGKVVTSPPATSSISCTYPPAGWEVYVIQSGDTLYNISTWYSDITVSRLMQENCLASTNIRTGQTLYVPGPPPPATISGIVVLDINRDNIYTTDEPGVPDVTLSLIDLSTNVTIATTTTNSDGEYTFQVSNTGTYRIFQEEITISRLNQHESGIIFLIRPANSP